MGEDPQRIKRVAAASYDYDNDPRWPEYWSNILIPPHMASRNDVVDHYKRKFYQRHIDPDFVVDPMTSTTPQPARPSSTAASGAQQARPRNTGPSSGGPAPHGTNTRSMPWDKNTIQFSINTWVLVVAVLGILPLVPGHLSYRAHRLSFVGTACSSLFSLYSLYKVPRAWNLQAIQVWLQTVVPTKDFISFIYSLTCVASQLQLKLALIPVCCRSLGLIAKFLKRNFSHSLLYRKYFGYPSIWVESNSATLSILSANAEILLGFLLAVSLFSWQRSILQTIMYWQLLKLMYHAPVTAAYHQSVWSKIGRTLTPFVNQRAPFLQGPLSAVRGWWLR